MRQLGSTVVRKEDDGAFSVWSLVVDQAHRRSGLGTMLMGRCHKLAGDNPVWLYVQADNTAAVALYTKLGYLKTDDLPDGKICMLRTPQIKVDKLVEPRNKTVFWLGVIAGWAITVLFGVLYAVVMAIQ